MCMRACVCVRACVRAQCQTMTNALLIVAMKDRVKQRTDRVIVAVKDRVTED